MKKIIIVIIALLVIGLMYLMIAGREVQVIKTSIDISAPPTEVWSVLTDIDHWQEWSPIIKKSKGTAAIGSTLNITMTGKEKGKDGPKYNPVITGLVAPGYFHWRAHFIAGFIFTNDKIIELEKTGTGTRLTHKETFRGLLAPIFYRQMEKGVPPMLDSMNKALKELVEK